MFPNIFHRIHRIFKIRNELGEVYLNQVILTFAASLIGIFIPVFLVLQGFGLGTTMLFFALYWLSLLAFAPVSAFISSRIGFKHTILSSMPLMIMFFAMLMALQLYHEILFATAVVWGIAQAMYWVPLNSEFVKNTDKIHEGDEIGHLLALPKIATIIAPSAGAVILQNMGFNSVFIIVIALLFVSVVPLFLTADYKSRFSLNLKNTMFSMRPGFSFIFFIEGALLMSEFIFWSLFIYFRFSNLLPVGIATSVSGFGIAIFTLLVGRLSDRFNRKKIFRTGILFYAAVWFLRYFASSAMEVYMLSFLGGMMGAVMMITVFSNFCDYARRKNILAYISYREIWLGLGRIAPILFLLFAGMEIRMMFPVAGILVLLLLPERVIK